MKKIFGLTKLNMIAIILVAAVAVIATAGGSIAYFSDNKEMTNTFTVGNVAIELTEAAVKSDGMGNLIQDTTADRISGGAIDSGSGNAYGTIHPAMSIYKDPTIKVADDSDPAYIAAKIIVTANNLNGTYGAPYGLIGGNGGLLSGGLLSESCTANGDIRECGIYTMRSKTVDGAYELYIFVNAAQTAQDHAIVIFDKMSIAPEFDNAKMQMLSGLNITVQAFAVQTYGFNSCYEAMTTAFSDHFDFDQQ